MALTYHNNNSISNVTSFAQIPAGEPVLLSTATASSSASISFNSTYINSDYKIYKFEFINIHPSTRSNFTFNLSTDNGSNYNVTKTTTSFIAYHKEDGGFAYLQYDGGDLAQSTSDQIINDLINTDNDNNLGGYLYLYNPSSIIFVKHFMARSSNTRLNNGGEIYMQDNHMAGYGNTTSAINAIIFRMSAGNIDAGQIKLYGIGAN